MEQEQSRNNAAKKIPPRGRPSGRADAPLSDKEYLLQLQAADRRIKIASERIQRYRDLAERCTATYSADRTDGRSATVSRIEENVAKIVDTMDRLSVEVAEAFRLHEEIRGVIDAIDTEYRELLTLRYEADKSWQHIADVLKVDLRTVYRMHGRALCAVHAVRKERKLL